MQASIILSWYCGRKGIWCKNTWSCMAGLSSVWLLQAS